jgi:diguanylate cyclase (GGDEF)-like protein
MNLRERFRNRRPDPSKLTGSYRDSLINVTRLGTLFTTAFFLGFALVYWLGDYPHLAVWVNLLATLCSLAGFFLITRFKKYRSTAHLVIFAIYISSAGVMAISGGIHSSSAIWQVFVPLAASIMAGLWAGLRWGFICLLTVIIFYALDANGISYFTGFEVTMTDRLIDLGGAILASSIAIWYSDRIKSRSLTDLERAKEQLNYLATIDPLTNTFNRRHFMELSERRIKRTHTTNGHASFLFFDLDHFKMINDAHGHIIGDQILHGIAQICMQHLRSDDILGRFGGEEFVILLPETKLKDAYNIAERLRLIIAETPIETEIGPIRTTISIGVALMDKSNTVTIDQLISRADRAMYLAKQAGRNRVVIWEESNLQTSHSI